jgi:hypothetical protein
MLTGMYYHHFLGYNTSTNSSLDNSHIAPSQPAGSNQKTGGTPLPHTYIYTSFNLYVKTWNLECWNVKKHWNNANMAMSDKKAKKNNRHSCPTPMTSPLMSSTYLHPPSQPSYLTRIPLHPPLWCLKTPACKKSMLSTFLVCYSDGQVSLSVFLPLIKTCCLWRSQFLSQCVSLFSFFTFLSVSVFAKESEW